LRHPVLCAALLASAVATTAPAVAEEPATLDQWRKLLDALQAAGCTAVADISVERDVYEVESALCGDTKPRTLRFDKSFALIRK